MAKNILVFMCITFLASCVSTSKEIEPFTTEWESLKKHQAVPEWFADAKFGIYFHWGVYSVPGWGSEWYPRWMYVRDRKGWGDKIYSYHIKTYGKDVHYHDFIPQWQAENFDAKEWVDLFENAGARIIGSIAEHHDGFSLWASQVNPWNSKSMGPRVDVVKAISDETKKRGLKFMATFHHGFHRMFYPKQAGTANLEEDRFLVVQEDCQVPQDEKYRKLYGHMSKDEASDYWLAKLDEVVDSVCPDYIWMDFGARYVREDVRRQFLANYFNAAARENKEVVVNSKGSYYPKEVAIVNTERATMGQIPSQVWITDFILGSAFSYDRSRRTAIDPNQAIRMLADVVSKNGVMLLSAGPMADGTIPVEQVRALQGIGSWMQRYGEAIYDTRPFVSFGEGLTQLTRDEDDAWNEYGAIKKGLGDLNAKDIRFTRKGKTVYAIQLGWPATSEALVLRTFAHQAQDLKVRSVAVLGSSESITWQCTDRGLRLIPPIHKPERAEAALVYKINIE